jgi:hypothetical protein
MAPTLRPQKANAQTQRKRAAPVTARCHGASRTANRTDAFDDDSSSVVSRMSTRSQSIRHASGKDDDSREGDLSDHVASESFVGDLWSPIDDTRPVNVDNGHAMNMDDKALHYLNKVNDHEQYPASQCAMGEDICMYGRSSSSSAEALNKANSMVRERHAVDCVNAGLLWLKLEKTRYEGVGMERGVDTLC